MRLISYVGKCYEHNQKCDFHADCNDDSDEKGCPQMENFDNCEAHTGVDNCGWEEEPHDDLDWIIAKKEDTVAGHPIIRDGKFLWIKKYGDDNKAKAHIESPTYQNSRVDCYIDFYYYKSGSVGSIINPGLMILGSDTQMVLDNLPHTNHWTQTKMQIGRQPGEFKFFLDRPVNEAYDAGVAVDDVQFVDCPMPRPTKEECPAEKSYRCENNVCIEFRQVCDFVDDCGDRSDEIDQYCIDNYIMENFEDDSNSTFFGLFHEEPGDFLHWQRQSGRTPNAHTGPSFDHTTFNSTGHYLYLDSNKMVNTEERALLVSEPFQQSSQDGPDCVMTINYHMFGNGLGTFQVAMRASTEEEEVLFHVNGSESGVSENSWRRKDIVIQKSRETEEYVITISANVLVQDQGDVAVDDIIFSPQCILKGQSTSTPASTSTSKPCDIGSQFTCGDGTCIPLLDVCNFHIDCPNDNYDEMACPDLYTFENCNNEGGGGPDNCGWTNIIPDTLDWQVLSLNELAEEQLPNHPTTDFENKTSGHILYVRNVMGGSIAGVSSPVYESSYTECLLTFWVFIAGSKDFSIFPLLTHSFMDITTQLDLIDPNNFPEGKWIHIMIGIGEHRDKFTVGFDVQYSGEDWKNAIGVDNVEFLECALPRPEESCFETEFHCEKTKACIDKSMICDYADNCGDESDEDRAFQNCDDYIMINFEDPLHPWGFFNESQSEKDFYWRRGNGTVKAGTGPPFDHTTFSPLGHYLYISSEEQEKGEVAWIETPMMKPMNASDNCSIRFFYHMHGSGVGRLTLYIQ